MGGTHNKMVLFGTDVGVSLITSLTNATGSLFLSLLVIVIFITALSLGLRLPVEFSAIFVLPLMLGVATVSSQIYPILGVTLIYLGFILGKNILGR